MNTQDRLRQGQIWLCVWPSWHHHGIMLLLFPSPSCRILQCELFSEYGSGLSAHRQTLWRSFQRSASRSFARPASCAGTSHRDSREREPDISISQPRTHVAEPGNSRGGSSVGIGGDLPNLRFGVCPYLLWVIPDLAKDASFSMADYENRDQNEGVQSFFEKRKPAFRANLDDNPPSNVPWWTEVDTGRRPKARKTGSSKL